MVCDRKELRGTPKDKRATFRNLGESGAVLDKFSLNCLLGIKLEVSSR